MDYFKTIQWEGISSYREHISAVIKVKEFSNTSIYKPNKLQREFINYNIRYKDKNSCNLGSCINKNYLVSVYPNGYDNSTEGHVSLEFHFSWALLRYDAFTSRISHVELISIIAIVDTEDCKRFPQSFTFIHDGTQRRISKFFVQNYISRKFLLTAEELLPDDTLTMEVEMFLNVYYTGDRHRQVNFNELVSASFKTEQIDDGSVENHYLLLDSPFAECLYRESWYFKCLSSTPMFEKNSKYMKIPDKEYKSFLGIMKILYGTIQVFTFDDILDIYTLADFYGIESVLDTCRYWLRLTCHTSNDALSISSLADLYGDHFLREIVDRALTKNKKETQVQCNDLIRSDLAESKGKWNYATINLPSRSSTILYFFEQLKTGEIEGQSKMTEDVSGISNCYI